MESWIIDLINQFGYWGVFLLIALENVFPPIPSEVILTFSGFMTQSTHLSVTGVILVSTSGSVFGAVILYYVGNILDVQRMEKIIDRYGKFLRLTRKDLYKAEAWFNRYGIWTVFFCRLIPLVRSLISIPAGMAKMRFGLFLLFTSAGTLIWNTILVNIGAAVGSNWHDIVAYMDVFSNIVYIIIIIIFAFVIIWYMRKRKERK